uniref:Uncharacterized protein n=1 Tax=Candidatus Kentrum sp. LFY TaxID=2126342 RepID=A0A450UN18_9GAMM|nr:MAG: hypothetical protein BECKLFY1418A_GA0070994_103516 [Candidatus Kentron sp. LFY]
MASMSIEKRGRVDVLVGHGWRLSYTFEFPTVDSKLSDRCPNRALLEIAATPIRQ